MRLKPVSQQTIVITGASSGNGLAAARAAAAEGARLVLASRNGEALEKIAAELEAKGAEVAICVADVASDEQVEAIAATAVERFGGFDSWVNNAAAAVFGTVSAMSMDEHRRVFDVNYFGLVKGSLVAAEHFRGKGGAIINVGSVLSDRAMIDQGAYSASKHAVKAFTDSLRMELERDGAPVSVTLIKPSAIHTPYPDHARNLMDEPARLPPLLYDPALVGEAVVFAAANPKRELYVGGTGYLISLTGRVAPRLTDMTMEAIGRPLQTTDERPSPATYDNLFEPRADGAERGSQDVYYRKSSLFLEAQKRPALTAALTGALALGGGLLAMATRGGSRKRWR